ncbi:aminotransferase class I/II-fold pyridoxal phosphate-dependent enzyme [candidate division KSB1 bacterium]
MEESIRLKRLPAYVFDTINALKMEARRAGEDIIDLGMGNPDQPPPDAVIEKLNSAASISHNHRYSTSRGIQKLRLAITDRYDRRFGVKLDPETEAITVIGAKEGMAQIALSLQNAGDVVLVPSPTYPIHSFSAIIAGGHLVNIPLEPLDRFMPNLEKAYKSGWPRPKFLILSFPHNPTTVTVDLDFFKEVVAFARKHELFLIHDFAYADICFDGYSPPSILQVEGAGDIAVELFSMSKSYSMAGWRMGFVVGNARAIALLGRLKSYMDYGIFQPIQIAGIIALNEMEDYVTSIRNLYQTRRDTLVSGLNRIGWKVDSPRATMYVWAPLPERYESMGSLAFSEMLLRRARVVVSPGIGFGAFGDGYVRFSLVENDHRIRQAVRGLKNVFDQKTDGTQASSEDNGQEAGT